MNFGFDQPGYRVPAQPWGWHYHSYEEDFVLDTLVRRSGDRSLRSIPAPGLSRTVAVEVPTALAAGKRVRIAGWIRTERLDDSYAAFGVMYGGPGIPAANDTMPERIASGSLPWTHYSHDVRVDPQATWIEVVAHVRGSGTAWFDDLALEIDGIRYEAWPAPPSPGPNEIAWLRRHTLALESVHPGSNPADLQGLRPVIGDARLLGLGEANHGTSEFFRIKHRLIEFAVRELGFAVVAIEDNQLAAEQVNAYVLTGRGDLDAILRALPHLAHPGDAPDDRMDALVQRLRSRED